MKNVMKFEFIDETHKDEYNESCEMKKTWYGEMQEGQVLDIKTYWGYCRDFAAAMGFSEKTIEEWFGNW